VGKKKSLNESELRIQQEVRKNIVPDLLQRLKDALKESMKYEDLSRLAKVIISLSGLDKQNNNINLGNTVNFNMNEGTLKTAFGLIGKMANIPQEDMQKIVNEVDTIKLDKPNKITQTNTKKVGKTKKELPNLSQEAYEFLED